MQNQRLPRLLRWVTVGRVLSVAFIALCAYLVHRVGEDAMRDFVEARRELGSKIHVGMSVADLARTLGAPAHTFLRDSVDGRCSVDGYDEPDRTFDTKCLVYMGKLDAIAYVFVDSQETVSYVFVGGS